MRTFLKWTTRIGGGVVGLVVVAAGAVYAMSERGMRQRFEVPAHEITVRADSAVIAQGARLVMARGCADCHGDRLTGRVMIDDPGIGRLAGPNLTLGGRGADLRDADWERAVRHGVRRDGSPLLIMPAQEFTEFSDEDLAAIIAYARSIPAGADAAPPSRVGPVGRALYVAGQIALVPAERIDHAKPHVAAIVPAVTEEFGRYIAIGCTGCHGAGYSGGKIPGTPPDWKPAANITPAGIGAWSEEDFVRLLRTGRRPDGSTVDTAFMPVRMTREMTDVEIRAVYRFLRTVPPRESGKR